jgi:hypothetical protein
MIHPQEALLQEARALQQSEAFAPYRKLRQAAEHRLARLMQLGVRQARYFGRTKTLFQLLMAATVANLTLVARRTGLMRDRNHPQTTISVHVYALFVVHNSVATLGAWVFGHTSRRFGGSLGRLPTPSASAASPNPLAPSPSSAVISGANQRRMSAVVNRKQA